MDLPKLVFFNIFIYLNDYDSLQFALTCHKTYKTFKCDYLWKKKLTKHDIEEIRNNPHKNQYVICKQATEISNITNTTIQEIYNKKELEIIAKQLYKCPKICYLKNITKLNIGHNNIIELDLSRLTNLKTLICYRNKLAKLDISGLFDLTKLDCGDNNLTDLDVSTLTNLKYLSCHNNKLTVINVSDLTGLVYLSCHNNNLIQLDLSNLTDLSIILCYNNKLISICLPDLHNISYIEYKKNNLTRNDIKNVNQIKSLNI